MLKNTYVSSSLGNFCSSVTVNFGALLLNRKKISKSENFLFIAVDSLSAELLHTKEVEILLLLGGVIL